LQVKVLVIGLDNSGKSTIINQVCGSAHILFVLSVLSASISTALQPLRQPPAQ
jgi:ribosome biogenesis GTPase A